MKPILNSCCCGCRLETGCKIIAGLYIFIAIFVLFFGIMFIYEAFEKRDPAKDPPRNVDITYIGILGMEMVFLSLFAIIAGVVVIIGIIQKENKKLLLMLIFMAFGIIGTVPNMFETNTDAIIIGMPAACIQTYLFLVVLSLYQKIDNESENANNPQWNNLRQNLPNNTTQQQQYSPQNQQQYSSPAAQSQYQVEEPTAPENFLQNLQKEQKLT